MVVRSSLDASRLLGYLNFEPQEVVVALYLDNHCRLIELREIFRGTVNSTVAHPREILQGALWANAVSILIAHNHPSGLSAPSEEDLKFTQKLREGCELLGLQLVDHLILGRENYFSFADLGWPEPKLPSPVLSRTLNRLDFR